MKKTFSFLAAAAFAASSFAQTLQIGSAQESSKGSSSANGKITLGVTKVDASKSLKLKLKQSGAINTIDRVLESMDANLTAALNETRKFELVTRSQLDVVLKEQSFAQSGNVDAADKNAAQFSKMKGVKYVVVMLVDDFQDYIAKQNFATLGKSAERRQIRFGANMQIIDSTTGSIRETANFTISNRDISDQSMNMSANGNLNDSLIGEIAREMSKRAANRVVEVIFPAKIIGKTGSSVTINRGDGTGIKIGDVFEVFALGEEMVDPDTGEKLGREEFSVGEIVVSRVNPKFSQGKVTRDGGIAKGQILRTKQSAQKADVEDEE